MWGHHPDSFDAEMVALYNLPPGRRIDMAPACRAMGIPGCCVVRWRNLPRAAGLPAYMEQFRSMKRVAFSITDSAAETFDEKVALGLHYADLYPNLTTFYMDDYFVGGLRFRQSIERLRALKGELAPRGIKLSVVLYLGDGLKDEYRATLDLCDEVSYWFWHGKSTGGMEESVERLRKVIGEEKPVHVGQYMWDFGGKCPMPGDVMARQLAAAHRLLKAGRISGLIFHCTPLVDLHLDAVEVSRAWIAEHGGETLA
jgi:hypothetical protein